MPEDRDALLAHYRQMRAGLLAAIDGLSDDALSEPSLDGWAVKDHLLHVAAWDEIRASDVDRISAGYESTWKMPHEHEAAFSPIQHDMLRHLGVAQARWELETSHQRLLDAIARATERGLDGSLYGEAGLVSRHEAAHTAWIRRWREKQNT